MDDLIEWFKEADGFCQGTKAPHKWVLQAEQEITALRARLAEVEVERDYAQEVADKDHARAERAEAALATARRDALEEAAKIADHYDDHLSMGAPRAIRALIAQED